MKKLSMFLLGTFFFGSIYSQIPKPFPNTYIHDYANVLNKEEKASLNKQINDFEKKTTIQLAIVLVQNLPENIDITDFSTRIGREWKVGKHDNGIVYIAVINTHSQRLEPASKLQGTITDATSSDLLQITKPYYRNRDFKGGISALVAGIDKKLSPDDVAEQNGLVKKKDASNDYYHLLIIILGIILLLGSIIIFKIRKDRAEKIKKGLEEALELERIRKRQSEIELLSKIKEVKTPIFPPKSSYNPPTQRKHFTTPPVDAEKERKIREKEQEERDEQTRRESSVYVAPIIIPEDTSSGYKYESSSSSSNSESSSYGDYGNSDTGSSSSGFDSGGASDTGSSGGSDW